jgi:L-alanine-DL-glutamate epimerase-like enolase superfamily enzyme
MTKPTRRGFLASIAGAAVPAWLASYHQLSAAARNKVKITDIQTMILQGPRTYTLVRVDTDAGVHGFAEAYGSPGIGIKEAVHELKQFFVGKDPLQIDRLYTGYRYTDGSAHAQQRAMSGIEMALWDLAGKLLDVPTHALLGGKFRDKVRLYDHSKPDDFFDKAVVRDWAQKVQESPYGINMHKFGPLRNDPADDFGRDPSNRMLSSAELVRMRKGYDNFRDALGFEHDFLVGCHWEFDLRSGIELAQMLEELKPRFLEDPLPVAYSESWKRLAEMSPVPICTGENWMRRAEALPFIVNAALDIIHPDLRNSGGFLENKRMADLADLYFLPVANHNTGSIVHGMATIHWASTIRDYFACETVFFDGGWMDDVIVHDEPLCQGGFVTVPDKPGLGIELDPDVVKAHLATDERWWG